MLFNSIDFALFLPWVFAKYWIIPKQWVKSQNLLLLIASYIFYGWWKPEFLILIAASSLIDFLVGLGLEKYEDKGLRKLLLGVSISANLGMLAYFKYANFFIENFVSAFTFFGSPLQVESLRIILPVGISFYTFQTLSYSIDVYRGKLKATKDPIAFFTFVSFFPQLVAGPIERAVDLLPQIEKERTFDYDNAVTGLKQILWGLFKKIAIADLCAHIVYAVFLKHEEASGSTLLFAAVMFSFQIYGDFSGYSDIAIGTARLFGIKLSPNFRFPYFSRSIPEFWRRWHISLTTWFRDYVYIPLGGSRGSTFRTVFNVVLVFVVSGFWHGARWNFIWWGVLNALWFLPSLLLKLNRKNLDVVGEGKVLPSVLDVLKIGGTFLIVTMFWIFFRADNMDVAFSIVRKILSPDLFSDFTKFPMRDFRFLLYTIPLFMAVEWFGRESTFALEKLGENWPRILRWSFYIAIAVVIFFKLGKPQGFIYFQF